MPCPARYSASGLYRSMNSTMPWDSCRMAFTSPSGLSLIHIFIKVRSMTSRWGVCFMTKRQITFALQLYHMPPAAQIYVVVHEYCHFLQPNHSPAFWAEVAKLLPDWKARRALLK